LRQQLENYKLLLSYDGSHYGGWQRQKDILTVAGTLEQALQALAQEHQQLNVAGRTDRGVHALEQVVSFQGEVRIPLQKFPDVINNILPGDVRVKKISKVSTDFHARFSAKAREYVYILAREKDVPLWLIPYVACLERPGELDVQKIRQAARLLLGERYLKAFCSTGSEERTFCRNIHTITIKHQQMSDIFGQSVAVWQFTIKANAFLYRMVRNMVRALVDVGNKTLSVNRFQDIVARGDRTCIGSPMPPQGLYLKKVYY